MYSDRAVVDSDHKKKQMDVINATNPAPTKKNTSDRGVIGAGRSVAKNKKTPYNKYRTKAMQWAKSIGRAQTDRPAPLCGTCKEAGDHVG